MQLFEHVMASATLGKLLLKVTTLTTSIIVTIVVVKIITPRRTVDSDISDDRNHNSFTARQYIIELLLKGLHRLEYRGYDRFVL